MKVGFTGTQQGMTDFQIGLFYKRIINLNPKEFHHGQCIGADIEAHNIINYILGKSCDIIIHPPLIEIKKAKITEPFNGKTLQADNYLTRNKSIVDSTDILIATPKEVIEQVRSGTWSTIRYARKKKKRIIIIYPNCNSYLI